MARYLCSIYIQTPRVSSFSVSASISLTPISSLPGLRLFLPSSLYVRHDPPRWRHDAGGCGPSPVVTRRGGVAPSPGGGMTRGMRPLHPWRPAQRRTPGPFPSDDAGRARCRGGGIGPAEAAATLLSLRRTQGNRI